ncbi:MAG: helix-turn-helix domain-containing protein [Porcipelethomonas sp.]
MDNIKTGQLICSMRKEKGMTQQQLGELLNVSDKAVSKWERGLGCPDTSLLPELAEIFGISLESLLSGELTDCVTKGGLMKNLKFYICPECKNIVTSTNEPSVSCCGRTLTPPEPKKAEGSDMLSIERIENDYFITSEHAMTKENYIHFIAFVTGDSVILRRLYPEWNVQVRIPAIGHGKLFYYSDDTGLMYQLI